MLSWIKKSKMDITLVIHSENQTNWTHLKGKWDGKGEICFGLHEVGKPPTLISPRPRIEVKRIKDGKEVIENEQWDDSMNVVLKDIPHEEIFKAMYDKSIVIKIDLT